MSTSSRTYLIALTDSRGRGLQGYLENNPGNFTPVIKFLPGRSLQKIASIANTVLPAYQDCNYYCIIHAGICSLTIRTAIGHPSSLRYLLCERQTKLRQIIDTIAQLKSDNTNRINICTITPASLTKFFLLKHPHTPLPRGIEEEQAALLEDIFMINTYIKQLNSDYSNPNINLCARFFSHSKKKQHKSKTKAYKRVTKFKDTHLVDGLHFAPEIRKTCFKLIISTASSELEKLLSTTQPNGIISLIPVLLGPRRQQPSLSVLVLTSPRHQAIGSILQPVACITARGSI